MFKDVAINDNWIRARQFLPRSLLMLLRMGPLILMQYGPLQQSLIWEKASISSSLLPDPVEFRVYCTCCYF